MHSFGISIFTGIVVALTLVPVETALLAFILPGRPWATAFRAAVAANGLSVVVAASFGLWAWFGLWPVLLVSLHALVIILVVWHLPKTRDDVNRMRGLLPGAATAVLAAVLIVFYVLASLRHEVRIGYEEQINLECQGRLKSLGLAVVMYASDHGTPPTVASDKALLDTLRATGYLNAPLRCPGDITHSPFPLPTGPLPYEVMDFTNLGPNSPASDIPVAWDAAPIHEGHRNCVYLDGHVNIMSSSRQALTSPTRSQVTPRGVARER